MKKLALILLLATLVLGFTACGDDAPAEGVTRLVVGATPNPHMLILQYIAPYLLEDGIELEIREFTEFPLVNPALADGMLDANFFQHSPFLNASPQAAQLYMLGYVHVEPMGAYSARWNDISELPPGANIGIPDDATNGGRALMLLEHYGLLELDPAAGILATISDIPSNPLNLTFTEMTAVNLSVLWDDPSLDLAIVNTNHILANTNLSPAEDSLIREQAVGNPYSNGLAVRIEDRDSPYLRTLLRHMQSERVRQFILREYDGNIVPVF
jgi:D-methionine transport system substrate-binding protein